MNKSKLFECSLGFHEHTIPDKEFSYILICKHCKRLGYYKNNDGYEAWYKYDNKGNRIHHKNNEGCEGWFHEGRWMIEKPINWEYENEL